MYLSDQRLKVKLLIGITGVFILLLIGIFYYVLYQKEKAIFLTKIQQKRELANSLS